MKYRGFVHLHLRSHFSVGHSVLRVEDLPLSAARLGFPAVALTDRWNFFGMMSFEEQAEKAGIRPIFGVEVDLAGPLGTSGVAVLLITGAEGYRNLVRLISAEAGLEAFQSPAQSGNHGTPAGTPVIPIQALASMSSGLAILTGGSRGLVDGIVRTGREDIALEVLWILKEAFGPSKAFVEVARLGIPGEGEHERRMRDLGRRAGLGIVPANDIVMLGRSDLLVRDLLCGPQGARTSGTPVSSSPGDSERYLKSSDEMARLFDQEDLDRAVALANECEFSPRSLFGAPAVPVVDVPGNIPPGVHMRNLCEASVAAKCPGKVSKEAAERLDLELGAIADKGFEGYFLAVSEIVDFCRREGIPVGPGRGSAAGSLVAYLLGISTVNPLEHGLIFERFMNPHRKGLPDIDIDVCARHRPRVLDFVRERFGPERVAQIVAFDHVQDRSSIRMAADYLGVPAEMTAAALKGLEDGLSPFAACEGAADSRFRESGHSFGGLAGSLVGIVRNLSRHAAGLVVSPYDLAGRVPVIRTREGLITHFDKDSLDAAGLVKMDILALKTLSVIDDTVKSLSARGVDCDPSRADPDDPAVYREITSGYRAGLFQIDRPWMDGTISRLKPACFADLALLLALIRPGPMKGGLMGEFFRRRRERAGAPVSSLAKHHAHRAGPDPAAEILAETDGMIIYQEQVMLLASKIGGFTMAEADDLRRAMSKKLHEDLDSMQGRFVKGAEKAGLSRDRAIELFQTMAQFAGYGFNKSHSVAYAFITHSTAWLKAHFFVDFAVSCLNNDIGTPAKLEQMIRECGKRGVRVLRPDVNSSGAMFDVMTLEGGEMAISFGLSAIRNVGQGLARSICEARQACGGFADLQAFFSVPFSQGLQKPAAESLAKAGAFDCFGTRGHVLGALPGLLASGHSRHHGTQLSIFGEPSPMASPEAGRASMEEPGEIEIANQQKEALGFALGSDSLSDLEWLVEAADLRVTDRIENLDEGAAASFLGLVVKRVSGDAEGGRKDETILRVDDPCGAVDVRVNPTLWKAVRSEATEGAVCLFLGRMHNEGGRRLIEASSVLGRKKALKPSAWSARISGAAVEALGDDGMAALRALMSISDEGAPVFTVLEASGCSVEILLGRIGLERDTIEAVRDVFGSAFTIRPDDGSQAGPGSESAAE